MKHSLTICFVTSREKPEAGWFFSSLFRTGFVGSTVNVEILIVNGYEPEKQIERYQFMGYSLREVRPKPSYWSGPSRLCKENWWSVANSRNTALALCKTEWIAFLDDRSVLMPGWLDGVKRAMEGNYIVAGAYEKRTAMTVEHGVIKNAGIVSGEDSRLEHVRKQKLETPWLCPGQWLFGCNLALPLEWALQVNGYSELWTDGLSFEDVPFGLVLANNGFPIRFDPSMKIVEDRTPELCGPIIRRTDKGLSPNDKSHAVLELSRNAKESANSFNLRAMRESVLAGNPFPQPMCGKLDWWDDQPIADFK